MGRRHAPYVKPGLYGGHTLACSCGWEDTTWRPGDGPHLREEQTTMTTTTHAARLTAGHIGQTLEATTGNGSAVRGVLLQVLHDGDVTSIKLDGPGGEEWLSLPYGTQTTLTGPPAFDMGALPAPVQQWTLYWRTGDRQVVEGEQIRDAMNAAGIGAGALPALDFYARGDDRAYRWDAQAHTWQHIGGEQ